MKTTTVQPSRFALVVGVSAALAAVLTSCATNPVEAAPAAEATPSPATIVEGEAVSGQGPTEPYPGVAFPIPADARSVVIDFECVGGSSFSVELGDSMALGQANLSGTCDGTQQLAWPVTPQTGQTLFVMVSDDVDWVAKPTFSTDEFAYDTAISAECEAFSGVYSAFTNADQGYTIYRAFGEAEWAERVTVATADLEALTEESVTTLETAFAQLVPIVSSPDRAVGAALIDAELNDAELNSSEAALGQIRETCSANHTPVFVMAEFGG